MLVLPVKKNTNLSQVQTLDADKPLNTIEADKLANQEQGREEATNKNHTFQPEAEMKRKK